MARRKRPSDDSLESLVDVFEAIKRAMIRRGFIRRTPGSKKPPLTRKDRKKLMGITMKAHDILFKASSVFPFVLFPDTVTMDREKLTFATRSFFQVAKIISVPIRDILSVDANIGPFFGSVHTSSRYFITNPISINFLKRSDALQLQRLLQGYIIAHEQDIDCANIDKDRLIILLQDLGKGDTG